MTDLLSFLKAVKDGVLCYAVALEYGQQAMGLDDTGVSDDERQIRIVARPAGFLGGLVFVWQGTVDEVLALDPFAPPTVVSNPPLEQLLRGPYDLLPGAFCWGEAAEIERIAEKLSERRTKWEEEQLPRPRCPDCGGFGQTSHLDEDDHTVWDTCATCNGTGDP